MIMNRVYEMLFGTSRQDVTDQCFVPSADGDIEAPPVFRAPVPPERTIASPCVPLPIDPCDQVLREAAKPRFCQRRAGKILTGADQALYQKTRLDQIASIVFRAEWNDLACVGMKKMRECAVKSLRFA